MPRIVSPDRDPLSKKIPKPNSTHASLRHATLYRSFLTWRKNALSTCPRWSGPEGFTHFCEDIGFRPEGFFIGYIKDPTKELDKDNFYWLSRADLNAKTAESRTQHTLNNETHSTKEWMKILGISRQTFRSRIARNWSFEDLQKPAKSHKKKESFPFNLTNKQFGDLTVLSCNFEEADFDSWICYCSCGRVTWTSRNDLISGKITACEYCQAWPELKCKE